MYDHFQSKIIHIKYQQLKVVPCAVCRICICNHSEQYGQQSFIYSSSCIQAACIHLDQECLVLHPPLCQHQQRQCIQLLGQGYQSPHLSEWCWLCWQPALLAQLVKRVDMSQSTQGTLLPDGGWVGSNWQGQLCCCSPSPPSHCSLGQWELEVQMKNK